MARRDNKFLSKCMERGEQEDVNNVFKLRNILYDKISSLTRNNKLQKGDTVEITLEIELIKPQGSNSMNSLVEVTIIEHNKNNEQDSISNEKQQINLTKRWQKIESVSTKKQNWFQRVISGQNRGDFLKNPTYNMYRVNDSKWIAETDHISHLREENQCVSKNTNPRSNFINILPEDIVTSTGDYSKSYKRVSTKNTPRIVLSPRPRNILTAARKPSLVKVISDLFLPSKKAEKKEAVKSVLNALKNEVNNIHVEGKNKSTKKKQRPPVHNLGKLVSNILVDMIEQSSNESSEEIKDNSYPVQYQSFFEPVEKTNHKISKKHKRKSNVAKTNVAKPIVESNNKTCCVDIIPNHSKPGVNNFNSINNCTVAKNNVKVSEYVSNNEINNEFSMSINKLSHKSAIKRRGPRRCNTKLRPKNYITNKTSKKTVNNEVSPNNSSIQWNGKRVVVHKDIKKKIEMLIVNELQNLALKEGMECDIKSLPPVGTAADSTSNVSSFLCELDVNDPIFMRETSNSLNRGKLNENFGTSCCETTKENNVLCENKDRTKNIKEYNDETKELADADNIILHKHIQSDSKLEKYDLDKNINHQFNDTSLNVTDTNVLDSNEIQVTYLNDNVNNWSADSKTAIFKSPIPIRQQLKCRRKYLNSLQPYDFKKHMKNKINSDFIKVIESDDLTRNNNLRETKTGNENLILQTSNYAEKMGSAETVRTFIYKTSNECESTIEIELNVHDLEIILQKAKEKHDADKILISAKCRHDLQNEQKHFEFGGKNCQSYTNYLLSSAAKKLKQ